MLLERLKKEFDENYEVSKRSGSATLVGNPYEDKPQPMNVTTPKSGGFRSLFSSKKD